MTIKTGISLGLIGKTIRRGSLFQENKSKILWTYNDLSADWLLIGVGYMLKNSIEEKNKKVCDNNYHEDVIEKRGVVYWNVWWIIEI